MEGRMRACGSGRHGGVGSFGAVRAPRPAPGWASIKDVLLPTPNICFVRNHGKTLFFVPEKPGLLPLLDSEDVISDCVSLFTRAARKPRIQLLFTLPISAQTLQGASGIWKLWDCAFLSFARFLSGCPLV